ncbi:10496_t:CDS:2 [Funneliformis mosseae]|uniref:10496_t:CDS:1 n=1 Tax=Funneliformis mosseae TaxID=27381 RepID=A0A9N9GU39_FUNMO|nr:10496_t:CDS:2 [Funneliformis mosseae]
MSNDDKFFASYCDKKYEAVIYFKLKRIRVNPKNQKEFLNAIICILETLNILIDWNNSDSLSTQPASNLSRDNYASEVFEVDHDKEVDI